MLTTATPIFENVPATFADPVGLADQQASGVVALIVVRYSLPPRPNSLPRGDGGAGCASGAETEDALSVLGGVYDAFVCVSGQLLTVARSTPDYRFPVMPAVALRRFIEHRDAGKQAFLSVYELTETECARFIETVFYSECMKLMVGSPPVGGEPSGDGAVAHTADAHFVADQIVRSGCGNGVLELNDFSDPTRPRIRLVDLHELSASVGPAGTGQAVVPEHSHPIIPGGTIDPAGLAAVLAGHMAGFVGRVLLYDRAKNRAALPDRTGTPFDLMAAIREANRLAQARRGTGATAALAQAETELRASAPPSTEQADQVETYLKARAERPRAVEPTHPVASGLAALVLEMQGEAAIGASPLPSLSVAPPEPPTPPEPDTQTAPAPPVGATLASPTSTAQPDPDDDGDFKPFKWADVDIPGLPPAPTPSHSAPDPDPVRATRGSPSPTPEQAEHAATDELRTAADVSTGVPAQQPGERFSPPLQTSEPHPLAGELDALRKGVYDLLADSATEERARLSHQHALSELGIEGDQVPPGHVVAYLRMILVEPPPKRWVLFKRQRGKIAPDVCGKLLAFHSANAHVDDACIDEAAALWARLRK